MAALSHFSNASGSPFYSSGFFHMLSTISPVWIKSSNSIERLWERAKKTFFYHYPQGNAVNYVQCKRGHDDDDL